MKQKKKVVHKLSLDFGYYLEAFIEWCSKTFLQKNFQNLLEESNDGGSYI